MNDNKLFQFTSKMEKDDYKKFLYITTFRKSYQTIVSLLLFASIATALFCRLLNQSAPFTIFIIFILILLILLSFLLFKLDRQVNTLFSINKKTSFEKKQTITLYDTYLTASNRMSQGETKTDYCNIHELYETSEYLIFYFNKSLASPVRKKDIPTEQYQLIISFLKSKLEHRYKIKN
ncbi:MAG: YcxB family protein [Velocimicrobium sp.]